jgi:hypothetical protein
MIKRVCANLLILLLLATASVSVGADDPEYAHPDSDWLTWTLKDVNGDTIDTDGHESHVVYVFLFRPDNDASCESIRLASEHVRDHPNHADKVLALCCDDTGAKAIKLFLRQEEYAKRVAAWEAEQAAAKQTAEQAGEAFTPEPMPDFAQEIEDEMCNAEGCDDLCEHHLPFATAQRSEAAWTWVLERMTAPESLPRVLKINGQGHVVQQWTELPSNPNPLNE